MIKLKSTIDSETLFFLLLFIKNLWIILDSITCIFKTMFYVLLMPNSNSLLHIFI